MSHPPLSTPLSQLLIAFTIEFDNELERQLAEVDLGRRLPISMVMWSNFLRFVGDGITVGELPAAAGLPKARVLSTLGGMERWGYVLVNAGEADAASESRRDGWGSARGLRQEWIVRPTPIGRRVQELWPPVVADIEARWTMRFGTDEVRELRRSLGTLIKRFDVELPEYLPIVGGTNGMRAEITRRERHTGAADIAPPPQLAALLAQVLLAYTLDFEGVSELSLVLSANFLRVLDERGLDTRDLPLLAGVSKEATSMALTFLTKNGHVEVAADPSDTRTKLVRLTPKGREAAEAVPVVHATVEQRWEAQFGLDSVQRVRATLCGVLDQRDGERPRLSLGLRPYEDGWRARKRYIEQTKAVIADPTGALPHYPMVLHRGGWPDGN